MNSIPILRDCVCERLTLEVALRYWFCKLVNIPIGCKVSLCCVLMNKFKCLKVGGWLLILPLCEIKSCGVVHCVKSVQIRSYFWSVFSCIQPEYRKIRSRNNSVFGHFSRSGTLFVHKNNETKNNSDLQYKVDHQERDMFSVLDKQNYLSRAGKREASPSLSTANPKVYIV